ncbi:MAG: hypothetical protein M3O41_15930 [Pseudomonadota bacterium]|nr:hypothetical protein [Pseudomonadota bacterium]
MAPDLSVALFNLLRGDGAGAGGKREIVTVSLDLKPIAEVLNALAMPDW